MKENPMQFLFIREGELKGIVSHPFYADMYFGFQMIRALTEIEAEDIGEILVSEKLAVQRQQLFVRTEYKLYPVGFCLRVQVPDFFLQKPAEVPSLPESRTDLVIMKQYGHRRGNWSEVPKNFPSPPGKLIFADNEGQS